MKVLITETVIWWVALADEIRPVRGINPVAIREAIQNVFSFSVAPTEIKLGQGIEFQNGRLLTADGPVVVAKLVAYNDGLQVGVPSTTSDAEKVLAAVLDILFSVGLREPITPPQLSYISYIVADLDHSIDRFFPQEFLEAVSSALGQPGLHAQNIYFAIDPELTTPKRGMSRVFRVERREGVPYSMNRYFSAADMTTEQHISMLAALEKIAAKQAT